MAEGEAMKVDVIGEASALRRELTEAERLSRRFGAALGDALEAGITRGSSLSDVLKTLAQRLSSIALSAALKPLENAFGSLFSGLFRGLSGAGSPFGATGLQAPASVAGAFGPAAANAFGDPPGSGGDLRGAAPSAPAAAPVTVNISTPDVEGFRRSEAQVSAALARAVARGRRGM